MRTAVEQVVLVRVLVLVVAVVVEIRSVRVHLKCLWDVSMGENNRPHCADDRFQDAVVVVDGLSVVVDLVHQRKFPIRLDSTVMMNLLYTTFWLFHAKKNTHTWYSTQIFWLQKYDWDFTSLHFNRHSFDQLFSLTKSWSKRSRSFDHSKLLLLFLFFLFWSDTFLQLAKYTHLDYHKQIGIVTGSLEPYSKALFFIQLTILIRSLFNVTQSMFKLTFPSNQIEFN